MFNRVAFGYFPDPYCHREAEAICLGQTVTSIADAPSHLTWEVPKGQRA
jgi:hypothetical protein